MAANNEVNANNTQKGASNSRSLTVSVRCAERSLPSFSRRARILLL